ncbi:unnamed protein product [Gongylonema pulchrum]|uniref:J domain-containing protein n=1 Tax=Gongylonema pulchrum TaxID=637853 RepID=A0A183DLT7_9BILA|nr:unnamed protein product [Gongylonema pulchrum]
MASGHDSDAEGFYDELRAAHYRKQRRAGGWQAMGMFIFP